MNIVKPTYGNLNMPLLFHATEEYPVLAACNERIVEIPFVHRALPCPFEGRVLDVGCRESVLSFELSCMGFEVWGIDIRPQLIKFPGVNYVQADVCRNPFVPGSFDVVIACSSIEHVGFLTYDNREFSSDGDAVAIKAIRQLMGSGGRLILTVPFGRPGETNWYRVYNYGRLHELLSPSLFQVQSEKFWVKDDVRWIPALPEQAEQVDSLSQGARAVACVVASPV
jgi:SAM-dependent methyltransferase